MANNLDQNIYEVVTCSPKGIHKPTPSKSKEAVYDEVGPGSSTPPPKTRPKPRPEGRVKQQIARMQSEPLQPDSPPLLRASHSRVPKPALRTSVSLPESAEVSQGQEKTETLSQNLESYSLADFVGKFSGSLPMRITVQSGICTSTEESAIASGDTFNFHFLKSTKVVYVSIKDGPNPGSFAVPLNSAVRFILLYNPNHHQDQARRGFIFESAADIMLQKSLPKVVIATKTYQGNSPSASVEKNEVLIIKKVKKPKVGQRTLKVFSMTKREKKSLTSQCAGHFSTKPSQHLMLHLPDLLQHIEAPFPSEALISVNTPVYKPLPEELQGKVVSLTHSSIETSLIATPHSTSNGEDNGLLLDIPFNLDIDVSVDSLSELEQEQLMEVTHTLYDDFDPRICRPVVSNECYFVQTYLFRTVREGHSKVGVELERPKVIYRPPSLPSSPNLSELPPSDIPPRYSRDSQTTDSSCSSDSGVQMTPEKPRPLPPPKPSKRSDGVTSPSPPTLPDQTRPAVKPRMPKSVPAHSHYPQSFISSSSHGTTQHTSDSTVPSLPHTPPHPTPPPKLPHQASTEEGTSHLSNGTAAGKLQDLTRTETIGDNSDPEKSKESHLKTPNTRLYMPLKVGNAPEVIPSYAELEYRAHTEPASSKNGANEPEISPETSSHPPATKLRGMSEPRSSTSSIDANSLGNLALEITSLQMNAKHLEGRTSVLEASEEQTTEQMSSLQTELSKLVSAVEHLVEKHEAMDSDIKRLKKKLDAVSQQGANGTVKAQGQGEVRNVKERNKQYLSSLTSKQVLKLLHLMGLAQYSDSFRKEQVTGELLLECDEDLLKHELGISSRLHRVRLLRFISGQSSTQTILEGQ